ncbi:MAG TPA: DUF3857 domain-containing protein [Verrucomicrobiae bacterium]
MIGHRGAYNLRREIRVNFQRAYFCLALTAILIARNAAFADNGKPSVGPPSKWVTPLRAEGPFNLLPADPSLDSRWVLIERQINAQNDEEFVRRVRQVLTPNGADRDSRISIDYDPGCQAITLHWLKIWRGTNSLNRLDPGRFQLGPPAFDAGDFLFSSEKTATIILDDIRPGDIIDYAYSLDGSNPALNGAFVGRVGLQYNEPVDRLVTRLLWPSTRKLYIQNHNSSVVPTTVNKTNIVEFVWNSMNVPALHFQAGTPSWYNPYPWVELSEFQKWSDVNRWALGLFNTSATSTILSQEMAVKITGWKNLPTQEERAAAALQFVQRQVRNLLPETGAYPYQSSSPSTVFAQSYGDPKDKSTLLVTLLRGLNIDASPMLVSARLRQTLPDYHASPVFFDGVIVRATINSQTYYLDPDDSYDSGPLAGRSWFDYGYALNISPVPMATGLTVIPPCPVLPQTTETAYFNIGGYNQESTVSFVTVAEGIDAEAIRQHFATAAFDEIEREYLEERARSYPDIRSVAHLKFNDDEKTNRVEITESYSIPRIWNIQSQEPYYHCRFYAGSLAEVMGKPMDSTRTDPLAIPYPVHRISRVEASWYIGWPVQPDNQTINNPAFSFYRTINIIGTNLVVQHEFKTTSSVVAPEAYPAYVRQLNAASEFLGTTVVSY